MAVLLMLDNMIPKPHAHRNWIDTGLEIFYLTIQGQFALMGTR